MEIIQDVIYRGAVGAKSRVISVVRRNSCAMQIKYNDENTTPTEVEIKVKASLSDMEHRDYSVYTTVSKGGAYIVFPISATTMIIEITKLAPVGTVATISLGFTNM